MEHITLSVITVGYRELVIGRARLEETLIHTNQPSASIDRRGHSDWEISFGSHKSFNKMSIDFEH